MASEAISEHQIFLGGHTPKGPPHPYACSHMLAGPIQFCFCRAMSIRIELDNMVCNVLFRNIVLEHPVSLALNHPVILVLKQVSGWSDECHGCTGTQCRTLVHNRQYSVVQPCMFLVAQVYVKLTSSSTRIKQAQHI